MLRVAPEGDSAFHRASVLLKNQGKGSRGGSGGNLSFDISRKIDRKTHVLPLLEIQEPVGTEWDLQGQQYRGDIYTFYKVIFERNFLATVQKSWNMMERPESWQWGPSSSWAWNVKQNTGILFRGNSVNNKPLLLESRSEKKPTQITKAYWSLT